LHLVLFKVINPWIIPADPCWGPFCAKLWQ
jgi:hypothetical protein